MSTLKRLTMVLAKACDGSPLISTLTVILFYLMFNALQANVETLIWGKRFEHWLDPVFMCCWIAYSAYAVYCCAVFNSVRAR